MPEVIYDERQRVPTSGVEGLLSNRIRFGQEDLPLSGYGDDVQVYSAYWYLVDFAPSSSFGDAVVPDDICGTGSFARKTVDLGLKTSSISLKEIIATIRSSLSLQIKELADVLHVKRPTVYSWINQEVEPSTTNRERLQLIFRLAKKWNGLCHLPMEGLMRKTGKDGHSLLDVLKREHIDELEVFGRFRELAEERMQIQANADKERPTAESIAKRLGLSLHDVRDQQDLIDAETGRRSTPD